MLVHLLGGANAASIVRDVWKQFAEAEKTTVSNPGDLIVLDGSKHCRIMLEGSLESYKYLEFSANKGFFFEHCSTAFDFFQPSLIEAIPATVVLQILSRQVERYITVNPYAGRFLIQPELFREADIIWSHDADVEPYQHSVTYISVVAGEPSLTVLSFALPSLPGSSYMEEHVC